MKKLTFASEGLRLWGLQAHAKPALLVSYGMRMTKQIDIHKLNEMTGDNHG